MLSTKCRSLKRGLVSTLLVVGRGRDKVRDQGLSDEAGEEVGYGFRGCLE